MPGKKGKLFADAMFPIQIVHGLRRLGYVVATVQQYQGTSRPKRSLTDDQVIDAAIEFRGAVLTLNDRHFVRLHFDRPQTHRGIIICTETSEYVKRAKEIDDEIQNHKPLTDKLVYVPPKPG